MIRVVGVVVLYYPDDELDMNIASYLPYIETLLVWKNSPLEQSLLNKLKLKDIDHKIVYMGDCTNQGVGVALNVAAHFAVREGYTHLLTMDQDSRFDFDMFPRYLDRISKCLRKDVMAFAVNTQRIDIFYEREMDVVITSGTIYPIQAFERLGYFLEELFIDAIDSEYCFRIRRLGYKIVRFDDVFMLHQLGRVTITPFLWGKLISPNYSASRSYYLVRNHIIVKRMYGEKSCFVKGTFRNLFFWRPLAIIFTESDKLAKLRSLVKGVIDGLTWNVERIDFDCN